MSDLIHQRKSFNLLTSELLLHHYACSTDDIFPQNVLYTCGVRILFSRKFTFLHTWLLWRYTYSHFYWCIYPYSLTHVIDRRGDIHDSHPNSHIYYHNSTEFNSLLLCLIGAPTQKTGLYLGVEFQIPRHIRLNDSIMEISIWTPIEESDNLDNYKKVIQQEVTVSKQNRYHDLNGIHLHEWTTVLMIWKHVNNLHLKNICS